MKAFTKTLFLEKDFVLVQAETKKELLKKIDAAKRKKLLTILLEHPQLNEEQVHGLNQYVFESRKITEKESVVRKILNPSS